jgi:hypothetical protein
LGNNQQNDIQLSWMAPQMETLTDLILDDSTWETVLAINPGYSGWLGNKFTTTKGRLHSVDMMWLNNNNSNHNPLTIDVFDSNHNLAGSSAAFVPVPGNWQKVTMPDISLDGDFYIMVRFDNQSGITDYMGMDMTAPSGRPANAWFYDGVVWSQMNALGYPECDFLVRATLAKPADCESGDTPASQAGNYLVSDGANQENEAVSLKSSGSNAGLAQYEVYRREYQVPVPGQDSMLTDWHRVATVAVNNYLDPNLDLKCYQYYARAMYEEGSSLPSNTGEACFLVGMDEHEASGIKMYPNPASDFLSLEMQSPAESMTVYNATGSIVAEVPVENQKVITLNVSRFPSGIYILKLTTSKGESLCRKFLKL